MRFPLSKETVVVVTGGSSGVGRATAHAFARRGVRLVLASRDPEALEDAARECRAHGATAIVEALDMSDVGAVEKLRERAVGEFGRIDVWVNCAALLLFGRFEEIPPGDFRRVVEANLIGYANGCRAAIKQFKAQGDRGVLINMSSMLGLVGEPFVSAYVATKFAIRGLGACLRQECIDTPRRPCDLSSLLAGSGGWGRRAACRAAAAGSLRRRLRLCFNDCDQTGTYAPRAVGRQNCRSAAIQGRERGDWQRKSVWLPSQPWDDGRVARVLEAEVAFQKYHPR